MNSLPKNSFGGEHSRCSAAPYHLCVLTQGSQTRLGLNADRCSVLSSQCQLLGTAVPARNQVADAHANSNVSVTVNQPTIERRCAHIA